MSFNVAKWTFLLSFCASWMTSVLLFTLSNCQTGIVSNFFHSLSTAAFVSGTFIAWGVGINLCTKLSCAIELYPLPAMWSSWSFGRDDFKRCIVDSCASTMHACFVFGILLESPLFASRSWSQEDFFVCSVAKHCRIHSNFQLCPCVLDGFFVFTIFRIDETNASQLSSVVDLWLFKKRKTPLSFRASSTFAFSIAHSCFSFFWAAFDMLDQFQATNNQVWWLLGSSYGALDHINPEGGFSLNNVNIPLEVSLSIKWTSWILSMNLMNFQPHRCSNNRQ